MEERQTQIREGAGLEESKLNVEFIDWLQRWSTPILLLVAVAALGMVLYKRYEKSKIDEVNRAFAELAATSAGGNPSPESLKGIAETYAGVRAIPVLARLDAADVYLRSVRLGVKTGSKLAADGSVTPEDALSADERTRYLNEAESLYKSAFEGASTDPRKVLLAIGAAYGLAAVAETRGDTDAARPWYDRVIKMADSAGFPEHVNVARARLEGLPKLKDQPKLFAAAELPKPPPPPLPPAPTGATGATGVGISDVPTGTPAAPGTTGAPPTTGAPATTETPAAPPPTGTPAPSGAAPTGTPTGAPAPTGSPSAPPAATGATGPAPAPATGAPQPK